MGRSSASKGSAAVFDDLAEEKQCACFVFVWVPLMLSMLADLLSICSLPTAGFHLNARG